ncbi:hypothetical protein KKB17_04685 [bacterium]|nr:hypothetical protein [bacterium]MCG2761990.1 hypothetical protein [Candidatus Atribacteria bacterium]MBU1291751.1 hypothetical protein [bacterium]MBU1427464.1 hypothetical protein [bacterium]MBU2439401.1 hypothetical protein [bacterium]
MRAALIYDGENKKLELFVKRISSVIERKGNELKVIKAERGATACSLLPYEFVLVGCPVSSMFKGKLPSKLIDYIKRCAGLERKKTIAFIIPRLIGNDKTLKNLMGLLESKGSFIVDFKQIRDIDKDSELLASRLK